MISINKEERPWGRFYVIHDEKKYKLKRIEVDPGERLSYQYHKKRSETWIIIDGKCLVTLEGESKIYKAGDTILIPKEKKHRVENKGKKKLIIIEIQTGSYFGEDDIVRLKDDYNRV
jgi:mannose-6-phosphate isomerase